MLKVTEIYKSIQGESRFAGYPCIFIRLTGCNLRCSYCDTRYAYNKGKDMSIAQILDNIKPFKTKLVQITGGEPLLQKETPQLAQKLLSLGYKVLIGTNGTQDISKIDKRVVKLMDIKCPDSKESEKILWGNLRHLKINDEIKFVLCGRKDYSFAKSIVNKYGLTKSTRVVFSPSFKTLSSNKLAGWILKDGLGIRLGLQIHKYLNLA
ncbi:MAG: 7-carboxy-7-deazaguanine synthase [Elusimicrobia bacterium RIFOXYA2_FULL_40_6]|nr:MAG: 7-carboxy-7-deazaguanine synthase [Elusimicrobia bacterium RIFOXYA2_FULL_40_6]